MNPLWILLVALAACPSPRAEDDDDDSAPADDEYSAPADDGLPWHDSAYCDLSGVTVSPEGPGFRVATDQYELYAEVDATEAEVLGAMLAAAYDAFGAWFGATPPQTGPLFVELWATEAAWAESIEADDLSVPWGAGGVYHSSTSTAYLWRQPNRYFTRMLLLHELAHQFHFLARTGNQGVPAWYAEGVAEYISRHHWDGDCLQLGVRPLLTQEDMPAQAEDSVQAQGFPLGSILDDSGAGGRPLQHQLFRYFEAEQTGDWQAFKDIMDAHPADPRAEFEQIFGPSEQLEDALIAQVEAEQEPMMSVYSEWSHVDPGAVDGWSDYFSIARLKDEAAWFTARFDGGDEAAVGGVLLGWDSSDDYLALVVSDGRLVTFDMVGGQATWWDQGPAPAGPAWDFLVQWDDADVTVDINGQLWTDTLAIPPAAGVAVNAGALRFDHLDWGG